MKTGKVSISVLSVLVVASLLVVGILKIQQAYAQVAATSSAPVDSSLSTTTQDSTMTATSAVAVVSDVQAYTPSDSLTNATSAATTVVDAQASTMPPKEAPPVGLTEAHIIGTRYIDYFTDGTTTISYPGDPSIDGHFGEKDAPIPTHQGLTWVHTIGQNLYDTQSGDLEVGDYAVQPSGSYIANARPFVSSTSTPETLQSSLPPGPADASTPASTTESTISVNSSTTPASTDSASTSQGAMAPTTL